ncbi:hypothetical protein GGI22_000903, partial [Coemansia erecta]
MVLVRIVGLSAALLAALPVLAAGSDISQNARIAGGEVAPAGDFQFVAYVEGYRNDLDGSICTGSLIAPNVVLTAAHCTISPMGFSYTASQMRVSFSHTPDALDVLSNGYNVTKVEPNSKFDQNTLRNDIALLILDSDIPSSVASPVKLYVGEVGAGTQLTAAGYGLTIPDDDYSVATQLMEVNLTAATQAFCASRDDAYDPKLYLCTDDNSGRRVCPGDSGGPLSIASGDGYALVGITDFISISSADTNANKTALELCSEENSGSFFTRAYAYIDWIAKTAKLDTSDFTTTVASAAASDSNDGSVSSGSLDGASVDDGDVGGYDDMSVGGKNGDGSIDANDSSSLDDTHEHLSSAAALVLGRATLLAAALGTTVTIL